MSMQIKGNVSSTGSFGDSILNYWYLSFSVPVFGVLNLRS